MLANGAKLYYSETAWSTSNKTGTELPDLKEIPEVGTEPELVANTGLNDANPQNEMGVGSQGSMMYTFKYPTTPQAYATSAWKLGREWQASRKTIYFREVLADGAETKFSATVSIKRTGGALNGVLDVQMNMAVNSDFDFTDPTVS